MPKLGKGQRLWNKAKTIIPGGNMLLSKRPEMFLPDQWPAYYSRAEGARIWDMDGNEYVDMSIMGIGANVLGYAHPKVDEAVRNSIGNGNLATLNAPEEVALAERLVELHPWADMARFARTGGEANAIAIRIARAASGRDNVAICGYHGWHDWYLATNLGDSGQLDEHLLPGLDPTGVPSTLSGSTFPFQYNDFDGLAKLAADQNIGVIQMEVMRTHPPTDSFLQKVRDLATDRGIVLIFDECTSGFRQNFGGLHLEFDVAPDMAVYGKALGKWLCCHCSSGQARCYASRSIDLHFQYVLDRTDWFGGGPRDTGRHGGRKSLGPNPCHGPRDHEAVDVIGAEVRLAACAERDPFVDQLYL